MVFAAIVLMVGVDICPGRRTIRSEFFNSILCLCTGSTARSSCSSSTLKQKVLVGWQVKNNRVLTSFREHWM